MTATIAAAESSTLVHNINEFFSDHYLSSIFVEDIKSRSKEWKQQEKEGHSTVPSELIRLAADWDDLATDEPEDETVPDRNSRVLAALGYTVNGRVLDRDIRGVASEVPIAASVDVGTGLDLVVLEGRDARTIDQVFDANDRGELLAPIKSGTKEITATRDAIDALYALEHPPRFVLVLTGNMLILTERAKWTENRYLAIATAELLAGSRKPERAAIERIAALVSRESLVPDSGESFFDEITLSAHKHATEISDDLRDAVRDSVEILANEVIRQRKRRGIGALGDGDADELKRQCLRVLYRLLFLLFAEARPSMGLLPSRDANYTDGYGLDRLRDLADLDLSTEAALEGGHIHESIWKLFELISKGHHMHSRHSGGALSFEGVGWTAEDLSFQPLDSDLFLPRSTKHIDEVTLSNGTWQQVLQLLTLSKQQKGKQRAYLSYAGLGINQLGAVYERIMSYTGHFCRSDMFEVAKDGDSAKHASYLVPVDKADDYPEQVFLTVPTEDGLDERRKVHLRGTFVLRLSGRDRAQSASFYTPQVLTECVVRHGLDNLLDQNGETTSADKLLELTICEPAMGSGAFLNETINQLATEYLARKQAELDDMLDHERYQDELQKVKAHFALHQAYGVDLNSAAVELAEVSLWLNCMYTGLRAPWFGLHLRSGNSLVGCRREVYAPSDIAKRLYLKEAATRVPLGKELPKGSVHHFLLPSKGWASAAEQADSKKIAGEDCRRLHEWNQRVTAKLTGEQLDRVQALAERVEEHWDRSIKILAVAERELRRPIQMYGQAVPEGTGTYARQEIEAALNDTESSLSRLRAVMNLWCELWFVSPVADGSDESGENLPELDEWFELLESILGTHSIDDATTGASSHQYDFDWLLSMQSDSRDRGASGELAQLSDLRVSWFRSGTKLHAPGRYFHWELEFAQVFRERGGFDLQVGNPPWVRPKWDVSLALADLDPFHVVAARDASDVERRIPETFERFPASKAHFLREAAHVASLSSFLGAETTYPVLAGLGVNLYTNFVALTWANAASGSVQALLHQIAHFVAPKGGDLRVASYKRLRELWVFQNSAVLFPIGHRKVFCVAVYGEVEEVWSGFRYATNLHVVPTLEQSLHHNGLGEAPQLQFEDGSGWDRRPHASRIMLIGLDALSSMGRLIDDPDVKPMQARLLRPYLAGDLASIEKFGTAERRLADIVHEFSPGWNESSANVEGIIRRETARASRWEDVVLQGPHVAVGVPLSKEPNPECRSKGDWSSVSASDLASGLIPRTNFQVNCSENPYLSEQRLIWGKPESSYARLVYRRRIDPTMYRTLHCGIIPPGAMCINSLHSMAFRDPDELLLVLGTWSSLVLDALLKLTALSDLNTEFSQRMPIPSNDQISAAIADRAARIYIAVPEVARALGRTIAEPLTSAGRREHMVELDALVALGLGLKVDELITLYRSQFPVLRKYEHEYRFDAVGTHVPNDTWREHERDPMGADLGGCVPPFHRVHRENEMRVAYERFADEFGGPVL